MAVITANAPIGIKSQRGPNRLAPVKTRVTLSKNIPTLERNDRFII
jgi:hypothetical protein